MGMGGPDETNGRTLLNGSLARLCELPAKTGMPLMVYLDEFQRDDTGVHIVDPLEGLSLRMIGSSPKWRSDIGYCSFWLMMLPINPPNMIRGESIHTKYSDCDDDDKIEFHQRLNDAVLFESVYRFF
jgi:hypothetical protein